MIHLILFGPPGSGKGTQAELLQTRFDLVHISTGDLFRYNIKEGTALGKEAKQFIDKGELVPDSVTIGMLRQKVEQHPEAKGFIFDGFPRTVVQAEALDAFLAEQNEEVSAMIALEVGEEELVKRLLARGRKDDNEAIIRKRFAEYKEKTAKVASYYKNLDKFISVLGEGEIEEISERLRCEVESLAK